MRRYILFLSLLALTACSAKNRDLSSPDGRMKLSMNLSTSGFMKWSLYCDGKAIILPSDLGLEAKGVELASGFRIKKRRHKSFDKTWTQPWGENKTIRNNYNEMAVMLDNDQGVELTVRFRLYDDGLGFRYEYAVPSVDSVFITNERTNFYLAHDGTSWSIPANFGCYEFLYTKQPISQLENANTPVTFHTDDSLYLSIHEAALIDFPEMTLHKDGHTCFKSHLAEWPDKIKARMGSVFTTPWRTLQVAPQAVGLINSNLIINLNEPCAIENTEWLQPVKYIGVWWGMHLGVESWTMGDRHGATTESAKRYIDFAARNNIEAVLFEGWNEGWESWGGEQKFNYTAPYADFDIEEIVHYAAQKNIQIIGHHETGGNIPYYESQLDKALEWMTSHGIHMLKTGYAGGLPEGHSHHGQYGVRHYQKVVETAAKYKVAVNAHEPIKETGIRRTWPNMMTREGVRGMEWNAWSKGNPPSHQVTLPFTRMLSGPLDYTPGTFDILFDNSRNSPKRQRWNGNDKGNSRVHTTIAKQLALWVILYSPMQMASDMIENYEGHPAFGFFRDLDPDCDWSKALQGEPGEYVAIVRRADEKFFLGAATNEQNRDLSIPLDFLRSDITYDAVVYADGSTAHWKDNPLEYTITKREVTAGDTLDLTLACGGGAAVSFFPQDK